MRCKTNAEDDECKNQKKNQPQHMNLLSSIYTAENKGFEPLTPFTTHSLSRRAESTTLAILHMGKQGVEPFPAGEGPRVDLVGVEPTITPFRIALTSHLQQVHKTRFARNHNTRGHRILYYNIRNGLRVDSSAIFA